jgi:hypothetical protein
MRMFAPLLAVPLVFGLTWGGPAVCAQSAQSAAPKPPPTEQEKKKLREKAFQLLDDTVAEAQALTIPNNRVVLLADLLPSLWKRDPGRAREVAGTLLNTIANQELQPPPPTGDEDVEPYMNVSFGPVNEANFRLYTQTLRKIGETDPQTALELLAATRGALVAAKPERNKPLDAYAKQLEIAAAKNDPEKLYALGKKNLENGEFGPATSLVSRIAERDAKLAAKFFGEIAANVAGANLPPEGKLRAFIGLAALVPASKTGTAPETTPVTSEGRPPKTESGLEIDESVRRALFTSFAQSVLTVLQKKPAESVEGEIDGESDEEENPIDQDPRGLVSAANRFLPEFTRYAPRLADQIKQRLPKEEISENSPTNWEADLLKRFEENKLSGQETEFVIQGIIPRLIVEGKTDETRKLIAKVPDPRTRETLTKQLESAEAVKLATSDTATDADINRLLGAARTSGQRLRLLQVVARQAISRKEFTKAGDALDQALALTNQIQNPRIQITAKLTVAALYIGFAPDRAFDVYEPMTDKLNEFLGGAAIVGAYFNLGGIEPVRGNEFNLETGRGVGDILPTSLIPLRPLALADFDRTRALVDRVRFPEIRAKLRLELLRAVLLPDETPSDATDAAEPPVQPKTAP